MFYFKIEGNEILKYEISYDIENVKKLQKDLANDCSIEKKYTYSSVGIPRRDKNTVYKKFDYKFVGMRYDFYGDDEIYEVNTIELVTPPLYDLINRIMNGNVLALEELFSRRIDVKNKENVRDIDFYYNAFQHLFIVNLVDRIDLNEFNKVREFMNLNKVENKKDVSLVLNRK